MSPTAPSPSAATRTSPSTCWSTSGPSPRPVAAPRPWSPSPRSSRPTPRTGSPPARWA
jgi:hypothetical protein